MKLVNTDRAAQPFGHYSQAVVANGMVYVSGILGAHPEDREVTVRDFQSQTENALSNLKAILEAAGSSLEKVVKVTIYADDVAKWGTSNEIYQRYFPSHKPARAFVPCGALHNGFEIEIEAVALA